MTTVTNGFTLPNFGGGNALGNASTAFGSTNLTGIGDTGFNLPNFDNIGEMDFTNLALGQTGQNGFGQAQNGLGGQTTQGLGLDNSTDFFSADAMKLGSLGINAFTGLLGAYTGLSGLSLAKNQFKYNKQLSNTNLANQAKLTNESMLTRQTNRLRDLGTMTSEQVQAGVDSYMDNYAVSGKVA